jgi:hypothetical protein
MAIKEDRTRRAMKEGLKQSFDPGFDVSFHNVLLIIVLRPEYVHHLAFVPDGISN